MGMAIIISTGMFPDFNIQFNIAFPKMIGLYTKFDMHGIMMYLVFYSFVNCYSFVTF